MTLGIVGNNSSKYVAILQCHRQDASVKLSQYPKLRQFLPVNLANSQKQV